MTVCLYSASVIKDQECSGEKWEMRWYRFRGCTEMWEDLDQPIQSRNTMYVIRGANRTILLSNINLISKRLLWVKVAVLLKVS